jgi:hypothetical protein
LFERIQPTPSQNQPWGKTLQLKLNFRIEFRGGHLEHMFSRLKGYVMKRLELKLVELYLIEIINIVSALFQKLKIKKKFINIEVCEILIKENLHRL